MVGFSQEVSSPVNFTNVLIVYDLTKLMAPNPTQTAVMTEDPCCLETVCQIPVERGRRTRGGGGLGGLGRRKICWDHSGAPRQKGHCGTD